MKPSTARDLMSCFGTLFLCVLIFGMPFAWILRDGLGPDSKDSAGLEAVLRTLRTFHIGTVLGILALLTVGSAMLPGWLARHPRRHPPT